MSSLPLRVLDEMLPASGTEQLLQATATAVAPGGTPADAAPTHLVLHPGPLSSNALANTMSLAQVGVRVLGACVLGTRSTHLVLHPGPLSSNALANTMSLAQVGVRVLGACVLGTRSTHTPGRCPPTPWPTPCPWRR